MHTHVPPASGVSEMVAGPPFPIADEASPLPSPTSLLYSVTLPACSLDASLHMPAVVLSDCTFQGTVLQDLKCFLFVIFFLVYYLCEKYHKPITNIADCVSWVRRLTLLDLQTNRIYECTLEMELGHT